MLAPNIKELCIGLVQQDGESTVYRAEIIRILEKRGYRIQKDMWHGISEIRPGTISVGDIRGVCQMITIHPQVNNN